ncbi:MAG: hypothetical protein KI792_04345 [Alphaproteobacteria bacterium]|nr:hypothetical protein [Alphaproteobacteria bacterium SS10]
MSRFLEQLPRYLFIASLVIFGLFGAFTYGVFAHRDNLPPLPLMRTVYNTLFVQQAFTDDGIRHHVQPTRNQGDGVTKNTANDDHLVFMAGFFDGENQARLIERDGTVVRKWSLNYFEHFPTRADRVCTSVTSPLRTDTHGALLTPEGNLVFNYEYCGAVKLNQCGDILWTNNTRAHHSVIRAEAGGYWILGRDRWISNEDPDRMPPYSTTFSGELVREDTILKLDEETGEILDTISIPAAMRDGGVEYWATTASRIQPGVKIPHLEIVHSNKAAELTSDMADAFPLFEAGDLAVSVRDLHTIMVIDPDTKLVKWHQAGPWFRQHDPEFRPDGLLSIYNNNVPATAYIDDQTDLTTPYTTNIITMDPVTRETEVVFGEQPGEEMLSVIRGQHEILPDNGMIIVEFDAGRVLEVDGNRQITWEFVNRYDDEFVGEISDAKIYPRDYFTNGWGACPN